MNIKTASGRSVIRAGLFLLLTVILGNARAFAANYNLEGQNRGSTTWTASNLQGWRELDYIPCRVSITGGPLLNQVIRVDFPHLAGTTPGFENLINFTPSSNAVILSGPTLIMRSSGIWGYTMTVSVTNNAPAAINFLARLAAGAHLNPGSSLQLSGNPSSMGNLQIHKPAAGPRLPDLALVKSGPALASPGDIITYTLSYTNKALGTNVAVGAQISDFVPSNVTLLANTVIGGSIVGNTIFWDLGNLSPGASGFVTFQAQVRTNALAGETITNFGQVLSSENDANPSDNSSTVVTTVVVVCNPPVISIQTADVTACPGGAAGFDVWVAGSVPFGYQWSHNGTPINGATNSSYSIPSVSLADVGTYNVRVTNACGLVVSSNANLSLGSGTTATPLVSLTNCPGTTANFSTEAGGAGPFSYQWYLNDTAISGETRASLVIPDVTDLDAGLYAVIVLGSCDSVTNSAMLVLSSTVAASPLTSLTNCPGTTAGFSTVASGSGPFSYQWFKDGSTLAAQTNSSLTLNNISATDAGTYSVVVGGACSSATNAATLDILAPVTALPMTSLTNCPGTSASFSTVAGGAGPFSYQWFRNGNLLATETSATLTLNNVTAVDGGSYTVAVSGLCGSVTNGATLTVNLPVTATPLLSAVNCPGTTATFSTVAGGTGPFSYSWYKDGNVLAGQTSSTLIRNNVSATDAGTYAVAVGGTCGAVTNSAALILNSPVTATPLAALTNCVGTSASFSTVAGGTGPFSYQWSKGGNILAGQTGSNLALNNVSATDAGTYSVVVSGVCGSVTNSASLTVNASVTSTPLTNVTNCPGTTASFSTVAGGTGPFGYQWFKGALALAGQTGSTLTINNVSATDAGTYSVAVSGACGSVTNSASLTVNSTLSASALTSLTNCPGTTAGFSTLATGTAPISYQWFKGGAALAGQTGSSLTLNSVSTADAGTYSVVVNSGCGSTTNSASLTINSPVSATPLTSLTNCPGTSAGFSTVASGAGPLNYQWYKGAIALVGQTGTGIFLNNVSAADAGTYSVRVSGACGGVTNSASLTVNTAVGATPLISLTNCPGTSAGFSTAASGTGPFSYQWFKGGSAMAGQTGSSLTLNNVSATDAGTYSVVVSGACGSVTNSASLTVNMALSATPLTSLTNCPGTSAGFSTVASGTGPFNYQWFKGGSAIAGQTGSSLTLNNLSATDAGTYSVVVSGACGNVTNSASLTVNTALSATPLSSLTNCPGTSAGFSTVASGTGPFSYQWFKGGSALAGQTGGSLTLNTVSATDAGTYSVLVSGACGSVTNSASLTVNTAVSATPLSSLTNCAGTSASFSTVASGTGPFSYQWFKGGSALAGQTGGSLTLNTVSATDAGTYSVQVGGACGSMTNSASLTVNSSTAATPMSALLRNPGESATFATTASGTGPFTYVWKKDGATLPGQNGNSLTLIDVSQADAGTYTVEVTGVCGTASQSAMLTVNQPPTVAITTPTNGTTFVVGQNITIVADAADVDGSVTNVEFFIGTNLVAQTSTTPYFTIWTNPPVGTHELRARATDNLGLSTMSAPVTIVVLQNPPYVIAGPITVDRQTGLYVQKVEIFNPSPYSLNAVGLLVQNLATNVHVFNASLVIQGVPVVLYNAPINPGSSAILTILFYVSGGAHLPTPAYVPLVLPNLEPSGVTGDPVQITHAQFLPSRLFLLNFPTTTNGVFWVQYSSDLVNWRTSTESVHGTGYTAQWIDYGPPATESFPQTESKRFYRVIQVR